MLAIGPSMANILEFYGHRRAYGLSVSPNRLHRNPIYQAVPNPDLSLRRGDIQYIVWDAFSARRSTHFERQLLSYVSRYRGRAVYTFSTPARAKDGRLDARAADHRLRGAPMKRCSHRTPRAWPLRRSWPRRPTRVRPPTPIRHIVVLMQENHSFDNYFGTYPGADGIPAGICLPRSFGRRRARLRSTRARRWRRSSRAQQRSRRSSRASTTAAAWTDSSPRTASGSGLGRLAEPARLLRRTRSAVRLEPRRPLRAVRPVLLVGARRQRLEPPVRVTATPGNRRADELPRAGYPDTTDDLRPARGCRRPVARSTSRTTTRRTRSPTPRWATAPRSSLQVPLLAMPRVVRSPRLCPHIVDMQEFYRDAQAGTAPGRLLHRAGRRQRAPAGQARRRADVRALDRQRADAQPGLEQHRLRAHVRQLGRLVRPRPHRRRSIATATGSACRRCSSARTPGAARSTTTRSTPRRSCASSRTTGTSLRWRAATRTPTASRRRSTSRNRPAPPRSSRRSVPPRRWQPRIRASSSGRTEALPCSRSR